MNSHRLKPRDTYYLMPWSRCTDPAASITRPVDQYRSIYLHKDKAPGNQRGLAKTTGPTARFTPSVPNKPAGDGGEAHRDSLAASRARTHTGTRASGRERAARSLHSAPITSSPEPSFRLNYLSIMSYSLFYIH